MKGSSLLFLTLLLFLFSSQRTQAADSTDSPLPSYITNSIFYKRWLWTHEDWLSEDGRLLAGGRQRALEQIRLSKNAAGAQPKVVVPGNVWVPIGPSPIVNGQTAGSQPVSGRIGDIAVNPSNFNHWIIGAAQGGLWLTVDAGANFKPISDDQASLAFGAVAFAPSATNVIYAGTGEEVFSGDAISGAGLLKSVNGGVTWQLLGASTFAGFSFSVIRVHPGDANTLLASTTRGVYKSIDGGTNWTQKRSGTATDIEVDSSNFNNQYCAIGNTSGNAANGIYRSINAGETWALISGPWSSTNVVGRIELAISPSAPSTLYVSIHNVSTAGLLGIWRTDNAWAATPVFTQLPDPGGGYGAMWYNNELIVEPTDPNLVYAGGNTGFKIFDGTLWTDILKNMHVDFHALAFAGNRLLVGNDGGLWSTTNRGSTYFNHNSKLQLTQFYHGSIGPSNPNFALGGSQDNGTARWDGTNGWHLVFGGDGADNAIANVNPGLNWAISYQNLEIRRTKNGGASFEDALAGIGTTGRPFIGRFDKSPQNDDIFITGTTTIWKSTNFFSGAAAAWTANSPDFGSSYHCGAFARSVPSANTYAVGLSGGTMRITVDGGTSWQDLDPLNQVPSRTINDLAFNPTNANILFAALSGTSGGGANNFWRSTNALAASPQWANISYPADVPARTIALDLDNPDIIYIGTQIGVWKTINGGSSWLHMGPEVGMPNVEVDELRLENATGRLVAFTHGRGAFTLVPGNTLNLALSQSPNMEPASVGCDLTFNLNVVNFGPLDGTGVLVTNFLPAGTTFSGAAASQGTFTTLGSSVIFSLGNLPSGSNALLQVSAFVSAPGNLTNIAVVASAQTDTDPSNNSSSRVVTAQVDTGAPQLIGASANSNGLSIVLTFSEPVAPSGALNLANYSLLSGRGTNVPLNGASFGPTASSVVLDAYLLNGLGPFILRVGGISDCVGNVMASTQVNVTLPPFILVAAGSTWRYLDDGTQPGLSWRGLIFDDYSWGSGAAQLGYGDGDEITEIDYGPDPNAKFPTYYFRQPFFVHDAAAWSGLNIRLLRDDGAVIYLNGTEVLRSNMPSGTITFNTLASATVGGIDESTFFPSTVGSGSLTNGTNMIAVEIHQSSLTSSDISFDLELAGVMRSLAKPLITSQPLLRTIECSSNTVFRVNATNGSLTYQWYWKGAPLAGETNTNMVVVASPATAGPYFAVVSNLVGSTTSIVATLSIRDTLPPLIISCGPNTSVVANASCQATVPDLTGQVIAMDGCSAITIQQIPAPGTTVGVGTTNILFSIKDSSNNTAACSVTLTILNSGPPVLVSPSSVTNNVASTLVLNVSAATCGTASYQWYHSTTLLPNQTNAALVIGNLQLGDAGPYTVRVANNAGAVTSAVAIVTVNRLPVAGTDGGATTINTPYTWPVESLLANDTDPDGDAISFGSVSASSTNGGSVTRTAGTVTYTPLFGYAGADAFTYNISDGRGGAANGTVEILVVSGSLPASNHVSIATSVNGYQLRFLGEAGQTYRILRSADLSSWNTLTNVPAPLHGVIQYEDTERLVPSAFYRVARP